MGLVATNGGFIYFTFTDNSNLAPDLVKFFPPPFGQLLTNVDVLASSFETVNPGDYGQTNGLFPGTQGTILEGWTVVSNDVAVVAGRDLYPASDGANSLALADGEMTTNVTTVVGQPYTLTFNYRGPGLLDWWPFEDEADDLIGTNNGTLSGDAVTYIQGEVGQGIQFPGTHLSQNGATVNFGATAGNFGMNDFTIDYWMNTTSTNLEQAFLEKRPTCDASQSFWGIRIHSGNNTPVMEICREVPRLLTPLL